MEILLEAFEIVGITLIGTHLLHFCLALQQHPLYFHQDISSFSSLLHRGSDEITSFLIMSSPLGDYLVDGTKCPWFCISGLNFCLIVFQWLRMHINGYLHCARLANLSPINSAGCENSKVSFITL